MYMIIQSLPKLVGQKLSSNRNPCYCSFSITVLRLFRKLGLAVSTANMNHHVVVMGDTRARQAFPSLIRNICIPIAARDLHACTYTCQLDVLSRLR